MIFFFWFIMTKSDMKYWVMIGYICGKNSSHVFIVIFIFISKYVVDFLLLLYYVLDEWVCLSAV